MPLNVLSASLEPGCTPDLPYAERRRNWSSQLRLGKYDSSDAIHETLNFGYTTRWNLVPNALFWSERSAPVTKRRSCIPTCSSTNAPSVLVSVVLVPTLGTEPEFGVCA